MNFRGQSSFRGNEIALGEGAEKPSPEDASLIYGLPAARFLCDLANHIGPVRKLVGCDIRPWRSSGLDAFGQASEDRVG